MEKHHEVSVGGLSLYTLGQIGTFLGDKTYYHWVITPEGLNIDEFELFSIDQLDDQVKPFIEKTLEEL